MRQFAAPQLFFIFCSLLGCDAVLRRRGRIYSNDTLKLTLSDSTRTLWGPDGSNRRLDFLLKNEGELGVFRVSQVGVLRGRLTTDVFGLSNNELVKISVDDIVITGREGERIEYGLKVERQGGRSRREEAPGGHDRDHGGGRPDHDQGGWNGGDNGGWNGGDNGGWNGGDNGGWNGGGNGGNNGGWNGGDNGGNNGGWNGGDNGGWNGGDNGGNNGGWNGGDNGGNNGGWNGGDQGPFPGLRSSITKTVEFQVTRSPAEDENMPEIEVMDYNYDGCDGTDEMTCSQHHWSFTFYARDEESGLWNLNVRSYDGRRHPFWWIEEYTAGERGAVGGEAYVSCCVEKVELEAQDVLSRANIITMELNGVDWTLVIVLSCVGGVVLLLLIGLGVWLCTRKKYSEVRQTT